MICSLYVCAHLCPSVCVLCVCVMPVSLQARDVMTKNNRNRTLYVVESGAVLHKALEAHKDLGAFPVTTIPTVRGTCVCVCMCFNWLTEHTDRGLAHAGRKVRTRQGRDREAGKQA